MKQRTILKHSINTKMQAIFLVLLFGVLNMLQSCSYSEKLAKKLESMERYERVSLQLAKENRLLQVEINELKYSLQTLKAENNFLALQLEKKSGKNSRDIASIRQIVDKDKDVVQFDVYKWKPEQLISMAQVEFNKKEYEKAAQFYKNLFVHYPNHEAINDQLIFQAGIAAYESNNHHDWVYESMNKLITSYPASKFYRGAKLWIGLTQLKEGDTNAFFTTVEEFRKKYRNTEEWKILSAHYESILQKYKR